MTEEDLDLDMADIPPSLVYTIQKEFFRWQVYEPTTLEADLPMNRDWWKFIHWIPKIKKDLYLLAISGTEKDMEDRLYVELGIDSKFFKQHYGFFLTRLKWMRRHNGQTHLGEIK